jgi:threonine dehydrogenase-like Zn-dependent dehydrogenase
MRRELLDATPLGQHEIVVAAESSLIGPGVEVAVYAGRSPGLHRSGLFRGYPWRPGYALVGRVLARGSATLPCAEGDRVLCLGAHASLQRYDASLHGPRAVVVPVGEDLEPRIAVGARFVRVALAVLRAAAVRPTDVVAVFGLGLMGNLTAQVLRLAGARVIGVSTSPLRTRLARAVGIEATTWPSRAEHAAVVRELSGGDGVDVAVDAAGSALVATACASVCRRAGRVVLLGTPREPAAVNLAELFRWLHELDLELIGLHEWGDDLPVFARRPGPSLWWDYQHALQLVRTGRVQVEPLITDRIAPSELPAMYRRLHDRPGEHLGVLVEWQPRAPLTPGRLPRSPAPLGTDAAGRTGS